MKNREESETMAEYSKPLIGLALSGGAARSIAHIAVLETLEQEGIPIQAIAGTSAGSIVGALYAAGMAVSDIKHILLNSKWKNIFQFTIPKRGLISSEGIYRFMEGILPVKKFLLLNHPLRSRSNRSSYWRESKHNKRFPC